MTKNRNKAPHQNLVEVNVQVCSKNFKPAVMFRSLYSDPGLLKLIVLCAMKRQPLIIMPKFNNTVISMNALIEKGILYYNKDKQEYEFVE